MVKSPDNNPYVKQVHTLPSHLLPCSSGDVSEEEHKILTSRIAHFDHVAVELGCGSGAFIMGLAQQNPKTLFVGFELRFKRSYRAAEKSLKAGLNNVLIMRTNARALPKLFKENSLSAVYVNFPDPWEKKRWKKHRLLSADFLDTIWSYLRTDGFLSYKTDHTEYFLETAKILQNCGKWQLVKFTQDLHSSEFAQGNISTEFELLFQSKALPVNFLQVNKFGA